MFGFDSKARSTISEEGKYITVQPPVSGPQSSCSLTVEGISDHSREWQGQERQQFFTGKIDKGQHGLGNGVKG